MDTCSQLATILDIEMMASHGTAIYAPSTDLVDMPYRDGADVFEEIGRRWLVRYIRTDQLGAFIAGHAGIHYVTPTPYTPTEAVPWLMLPRPLDPPLYALLLRASEIPLIQGPRAVRLGSGIEYVLPKGFPHSAVVPPGWETQLR